MQVIIVFLYKPKTNKWFGKTVYDAEASNTYMGDI